MYTHMCVYINVYAYIYTDRHTYIYIHTHIYIYTHACTHIYIRIKATSIMYMHTYTQIENLTNDASTRQAIS